MVGFLTLEPLNSTCPCSSGGERVSVEIFFGAHRLVKFRGVPVGSLVGIFN